MTFNESQWKWYVPQKKESHTGFTRVSQWWQHFQFGWTNPFILFGQLFIYFFLPEPKVSLNTIFASIDISCDKCKPSPVWSSFDHFNSNIFLPTFSLQIFRGNIDNNTPFANSFTPPIEAQYVRIYPQVCRRHCTLRMELLGCELTGESPR